MQNKSTPETRSRKCLKDNRIWCGKTGCPRRRDCISCTKKYTVDRGMSITKRVNSHTNGSGGGIGVLYLPAGWVGKKVEITLVKEIEVE
jgi:hypothetical protein